MTSIDTRFTKEEQFLLINTPFAIGSAMTFAGNSGLGTIKELFANTKSFLKGVKTFPNNKIITGLLPKMENFSETRAESKILQEGYIDWVKENNINSYDTMKPKIIEDSKKVATLLKKKATDEEIKEYNEWAMSIAKSVANAAKEGGFLGIGGERVSANEKILYEDVAKALGSSSSTLA